MFDGRKPAVTSAAATSPGDPIWDVAATPAPAEAADGADPADEGDRQLKPGDPIWDTPRAVGAGDPIWDGNLAKPTGPAEAAGQVPARDDAVQTANPDDPSTT